WLGSTQTTDNSDAVALAEAVTWLWENQHDVASDSRRLMPFAGRPILILLKYSSDRLEAVIAGPSYLSSFGHTAVLDPTLQCMLSDGEGRPIVGNSPSSHMTAIRTTAETQLPWTLHVSGTDSKGASISPRRSLLLWVAAVLAIVWLTGAIFI